MIREFGGDRVKRKKVASLFMRVCIASLCINKNQSRYYSILVASDVVIHLQGILAPQDLI